MTTPKDTTGRKTRTGKPYLGRPASPDALVYKLGFIVGGRGFRRSSPATKAKASSPEPPESKDGDD